MKKIQWNPEKSQQILENQNRGISLELIAELIQSDCVMAIETRPNYPEQSCFVVNIGEDVWCVPFRENKDIIFLITAWPDRKFKKKYLK